ncbi:hypothetical protein K438DRAFT_2008731 [Mycena galopus ATCC 62051]|nr:hypothetical protein K438DRAFT_2008731 [Mycena galopus ATCC 62051]
MEQLMHFTTLSLTATIVACTIISSFGAFASTVNASSSATDGVGGGYCYVVANVIRFGHSKRPPVRKP